MYSFNHAGEGPPCIVASRGARPAPFFLRGLGGGNLLEQFTLGCLFGTVAFGTICPGGLGAQNHPKMDQKPSKSVKNRRRCCWNDLSQRLFLERFVPEVVFGMICPKDCFWNDLSRCLGAKNHPKMTPKTIKRRPKSIQKALWRPRCVQKTFFYRFSTFLAAFGGPRGLPERPPNHQKI